MKRSPWRHLKNKWVIIGTVILIIVALIIWARNGSKSLKFETATVAVGNVTETVSVTGTISPLDKADLAFQKSGSVAAVYVKVGDHINKGDKIAMLDDSTDRAALASAEATLADASRNLTASEITVQETAVNNARTEALNASHDAYVKAQSALFNYTDSFFSGPQGANPTITIHVDSPITQNAINRGRLNITDLLSRWSTDLTKSSVIDAAQIASESLTSLRAIKSFVNDLSAIVNYMNSSNPGVSQATINTYLAAVNSALTNINAAIDAVTAAQSALSTAQSNYDLKLAGNSSQSIAALSAKAAQARALLYEDTLVSPIDGVVTKADPNVGEFVGAGQTAFSVQNSSFKIEAFVPEADIAKVLPGNLASSTLDAYGSDIDFPARVASIDPAETVLEGVPTYKVTLMFVVPDSRIRSGMTANLDIHTRERTGVLAVPYRAVSDEDGTKTVRIASADGKTFVTVPVTTGLKGSDGTIEIVSGLSAGDRVVTYIK
jgi:HlyD family secretion protein